jgi:hypothetical protein
MSEQMTVTVHAIAEDGLPDMDSLVGRVAFIWDGAVISGWPITPGGDDDYGNHGWDASSDGVLWEGSEDRCGGPFGGVTHWIELPVPAWLLAEDGSAVDNGSHYRL